MSLYPWQHNDWQRLQSLRQRLPQGLLIHGIEGDGKLEMARQFAYSLLCQQPDDHGHACGQCPSCHWLSQGSHPDCRFLLPDILNPEKQSDKKLSRQISVEQVRELSDFITMSSHQGGRRVAVIYPAEAMNANAANALLKNLEEPPDELLFILVSNQPQLLLPTILSRCLSFALTLPESSLVINWLQQQGVENAASVLAAAGFAPLPASEVNAQDEALRCDILRELTRPDTMDIFALSEKLQKHDLTQLVVWLQQWCYDISAWQLTGQVRYYQQHQDAVRKLAKTVPALKLMQLYKYLLQARRESQHTLNPRLFVESLLICYRRVMRT